jgi:hypothetical protein
VACAAPTEDGPEGQGSTESDLVCTSSRATKLASVALKMNGQSSQHRCYHYVKQHLQNAGFDISPVAGQVGAYEFGDWGRAHPTELATMGFQKIAPSLNQIPKGSILVWHRGQCGYSAQYGHIEIVVDDNSSRACSDFCGKIKKTCGQPDIYAPKGCGSGSSSPPGALKNDPAASVDDGVGDATGSSTKANPPDTVSPARPPDPPQTSDPPGASRDDDCSGLSDGWYCSSSDTSLAVFCQGQQSVDSWSCSDGTVCRPNSSGRASLVGSNPGCYGSR